MMPPFSSTKKFMYIVAGIGALALLIVFPFVWDMARNSIRAATLAEQTKAYRHPPDSRLVQRVAMVGSFAPASNQCGFIIGELRTSARPHEDVYAFYAPILNLPSSHEGPPYHEIHLFDLQKETDRERLERLNREMYEWITSTGTNGEQAYLLLTAETGYTPNNDIRCH